MTEEYLIWSNEHRAWWRPKRAGYTARVDEAGIYKADEAITICALGRDGWRGDQVPYEIPVRLSDVIDCQYAYDQAS